MTVDLDTIFPPTDARREYKYTGVHGIATGEGRGTQGRVAREDVHTRWASIYTLELRGLGATQIATHLNMTQQTVSKIVRDPRYIAYREEHLTALDTEFVSMKPLAYAALKNGLNADDENTALRASEQWFKAAGFGGFSKTERPNAGVTAEDVVARLLNVNVQVNINKE